MSEEIENIEDVNEVVEETVVEESVEKPTDNEIIDELVAAVEKKTTKKTVKPTAPGMYHTGRLIEAIPSRLGSKWVVVIDGKRERVLRSEIQTIE